MVLVSILSCTLWLWSVNRTSASPTRSTYSIGCSLIRISHLLKGILSRSSYALVDDRRKNEFYQNGHDRPWNDVRRSPCKVWMRSRPTIGFRLLLVLAIVSLALSSLELPVPLAQSPSSGHKQYGSAHEDWDSSQTVHILPNPYDLVTVKPITRQNWILSRHRAIPAFANCSCPSIDRTLLKLELILGSVVTYHKILPLTRANLLKPT